MATPLFLAAGAFSAATAATGAVASIQQGRFAAGVAEENRRLAERIGERNAQLELRAARIEESRTRRQTARQIGATTARFGASGVQVGSGSPLAAIADQAAEAEELALLVRARGDLAAQQARFGAALNARQQQIAGIQARQSSLAQALGIAGEGFGAAIETRERQTLLTESRSRRSRDPIAFLG